MKKKAGLFLKQIVSILKNKTGAFKARILMLSLIKNKKLLFGSISDKIHNLLQSHHDDGDDDNSKAIILYTAGAAASNAPCSDDHCKYPDLTHSLFEEEGFDDFDGDQAAGSVIDLVRNSREDDGENFSLEAEIDHVADLFIMRFHKQMRLQKLLSFKRQQQENAASMKASV